MSRALILKEDEIYQYFSIEGADNENTEFKYLQRHPQQDDTFGQSQEQVHIQEETAWQMRCLGDTAWIDAQVPGTVYTDLLRNGRIDDPFWKDNEDRICALMEKRL